MFNFRQFSVNDDLCAMKIGTDGVLLGAWTVPANATTILDVGTGSGLLAMMMAQKSPSARIIGIDIDQEAVEQAKENVANSKWYDRITIFKDDFNCPVNLDGLTFDFIISNPPFYAENTHSVDPQRDMARNMHSLPIENLIKNVNKHLNPDGRFSLIVPSELAPAIIGEAAINSLFLTRRCEVYSKPGTQPKRTLLEFANHISPTIKSEITIFNHNSTYTPQFQIITKDFYL